MLVKVFAAIALVALFSVIVPGVIGAVLSAGLVSFRHWFRFRCSCHALIDCGL